MIAMDALPSFEQFFAVIHHFAEQPPHVGFLDADAEHQFRNAIRSDEIDFRVSFADDMDMRRLVIGRVDHETEAASAVHDEQDGK
jgi:hypothetical protein